MDYDLSKDAMNRQTKITIRLSHEFLDDKKARRITLLSPENDPVRVRFKIKPDGVYVTVPEVDF